MDFTKSSRSPVPLTASDRRETPSVRATERTALSARRLWFYGMGMMVPLLYFARRYPLLPNSQRRTDVGQLAHYGRPEFLAFVGGLVMLYAFYLLALNTCQRLPLRKALPPIFSWAVAFGAAMIWMYPVNATDVFHYAVRSRLLTTYGANPLVALVQNYPKDAWRPFASDQWARVASPYGPLWNLIAAPVTYLAGNRMTLALIGFKLLSLLSVLGAGWAISRSLAAKGDKARATGVLLFLWNPLVLWEGVGNAHNDVVMTFALVLALLAWSTRRDTLVVPLIVVAATIKYVPALLIPLAAIACWQRAETWPARWRLVGWSCVWSAVALLVAFYPFYDLHAVRGSVQQQADILRMSPAAAAILLLRPHFQHADLRAWLRLGGAVVLFGLLGSQACLVWQRPSHLPRAMFEVLCIFLIVSTWYFNGWYLVWIVGLAALLPWGWAGWRTIAWTASALAGYGLLIWIQAWRHLDFATVQQQGVELMFGPVVLFMLAEGIVQVVRMWQANGKVHTVLPIPTTAHRSLRRW